MAVSHKQPPSQTDLDLVQRRTDNIFLNCKEIGWLGNAHFALKSEIFHPRCWQPCHFPRIEISDVREFMDAGEITNLQFELDQQIAMAVYTGTSCLQCCNIELHRVRGKSNASRNWFGRKHVVSPTLSGIIGLLNWLAIASVLYCRQKGWIVDWNLSYQDLILGHALEL